MSRQRLVCAVFCLCFLISGVSIADDESEHKVRHVLLLEKALSTTSFRDAPAAHSGQLGGFVAEGLNDVVQRAWRSSQESSGRSNH